MKQILLVLLLANGVFFLWEKYVRPGMDAIPTHTESQRKLDNIVLIKELPPVPPVQLEEPMATVPQAKSAPAPTTPTSPVPAAATVVEPSMPPQPPALPSTKPAVAEAAKSAPPVNSSPAMPATSTPPAKPPMVEPAPTAAPPASPTKPLQAQCRRIGPLASEADAESLRQRLASAGTKADIERQSLKQDIGYWVLHPPAADLQAAKANKALLQQKGAADTLIIKEGEFALAVSVGFFKERARAEKALAEALAKNMPVEIRPRQAQRDEYWLTLHAEPSAPVEAQWNAWRGEHPGSTASNRSCP